jgi:hypothetical protein
MAAHDFPEEQQGTPDNPEQEVPCGVSHTTIEEALIHAELNLGIRNEKLELLKGLKPYLGRNEKSGTKGHVVGWETNKRSRFRLDYAYPDASQTQVGKGTQGVHVNEEDFNRPYGRQRVVHPTEASLKMAEFYWKRWARPYGKPYGMITKDDLK